jgi:hypothetical protein
MEIEPETTKLSMQSNRQQSKVFFVVNEFCYKYLVRV